MIRDMEHKAKSYDQWDKIEHDLFHVKVARVLAHKLKYVEPDKIMITDRRGFFSSLGGMVQMFFERKIGSAIAWWPLPEPSRTLDDVPRIRQNNSGTSSPRTGQPHQVVAGYALWILGFPYCDRDLSHGYHQHLEVER
jgi:hypothetical protein